MRSTLLAFAAALMIATGPAHAGGGATGDWELGLYGGYGWLDEYGAFHPKDAPLFGARIGYFFTPQWSFEVSGQRIFSKTEFATPGPANVDANLDGYRLNGLYNFGEVGAGVRPFLTAGLGLEKTQFDTYDAASDVGWNLGAGIRWLPSPSWNIRTEARYVMTNVKGPVDESQANVEATIGISMLFGGGGGDVVSTPPSQNLSPTVTCASERAEILPGESVTIRATGSDPDGDSLTYAWSSTAGRLVGSGNTATFDFTGATPPASATITVRVSDGHGNTAASDCGVSLREPERPAEAVSCLAGGFPANLSRLNNVDKACLDDVAQRLKADPRASVVVVGHADTQERTPQQLGQSRAEAVQAYLVSERGIEASRVTARSVGATRPLGTGTDVAARASNRRVEVWFVPEGATAPN